MGKPLLIIFYNNPELGSVKPRLAAAIGEDSALAIYLGLTSSTRETVNELPFDKAVFYSSHIDTEDSWDNAVYKKQRQQGFDLGKKLQNAFSWGFRAGYSTVAVIQADCYDLSPEILIEAFEYLDEADSVIGPAKDGGYYLLGLKKIHSELFKDKNWNSHTVLGDTLQDFEDLNLEYGVLPVLNDVADATDIPLEFRKTISTLGKNVVHA